MVSLLFMVEKFCCFTSLLLLQLPAFTTIHSIHMQKFAKKTFVVVKSSTKYVKLFTVNNKKYMVYVCSRLGG